jgi:hypothetical protein
VIINLRLREEAASSQDRGEEALARAIASAYDVDAEPLVDRIDWAVGQLRLRGGWDDEKVRRLLKRWGESFSERRSALPTEDEAIRDLEAWLGLKPTRRAWRTGVGWVFDHATPVFTLMTIAGSAFFGLAYFRFYDDLGLTPEEAGLSTAQILARSVLGTLTLLVTISVSVYLLLLPFIPRLAAADVTPTLAKPLSRREKLALFVLVLVDGSLLAIVADKYVDALPHWVTIAAIALLALACAAVTLTFKARATWPPLSVGFRPLMLRARDFVGGFLVCVALTFALVTLVIHRIADDQARDARQGKAVRGWSFLQLPVLGVRAEPADLAWKAKPNGLAVPQCVLYLGRRDSSLVVYDVVRKNTLRLSASDVVVSVRRDRTSCYAPTNTQLPKVIHLAEAKYTCNPGKWENEEPPLSYQWRVDGKREGGDADTFDAAQYVVSGAQTIACQVTASNVHGRDAAYSTSIRLASEDATEVRE